MKTFRAFLSALFLFAALPAFAASTKSDYQKDFDFGQLRTFAFKTERDSKDRLATNTLEAARIQNALAAQLEAKGFTPSNDNPDFIVAFYSRTRQKTQVNSTGFGFGLRRSFSRSLALGIWTGHLDQHIPARLRHGRHH
jgi:hypothetical protein